MSNVRDTHRATQLSMPGMPRSTPSHAAVNAWSAAPGREVMYLGKISGGPRYGAFGVVKQTCRSRAIVDMGMLGVWHIPYYFLALPRAA